MTKPVKKSAKKAKPSAHSLVSKNAPGGVKVLPKRTDKNTVTVRAEALPHGSRLGGSEESSFNWAILRETASAASVRMMGPEDENTLEKFVKVVSTALAAFEPADEIEGMIAAQAVALHFGAMEALRRAMHSDQPAEIAARLRKDGANLARAMTDMLDALDRKRGKAQQIVRVERVVVEDGGQAIVGTVNAAPKVERGLR